MREAINRCLRNAGALHAWGAPWSCQISQSEAAGPQLTLVLHSKSAAIEPGGWTAMDGERTVDAATFHFAVRQGAISLVEHLPANQGGLIRPVSPGHGDGTPMCRNNHRSFGTATGGTEVDLEETKKRGFVLQARSTAARSMHPALVGNEYLRVVCERVQSLK